MDKIVNIIPLVGGTRHGETVDIGGSAEKQRLCSKVRTDKSGDIEIYVLGAALDGKPFYSFRERVEDQLIVTLHLHGRELQEMRHRAGGVPLDEYILRMAYNNSKPSGLYWGA